MNITLPPALASFLNEEPFHGAIYLDMYISPNRAHEITVQIVGGDDCEITGYHKGALTDDTAELAVNEYCAKAEERRREIEQAEREARYDLELQERIYAAGRGV